MYVCMCVYVYAVYPEWLCFLYFEDDACFALFSGFVVCEVFDYEAVLVNGLNVH